MLKTFLFLMTILAGNLCSSQSIVFQDLFYGGVTAGGYNPSWNSNATGIIDINIEPGSAIRKAFLFVGAYNNPETKTIFLNGHSVTVDENNSLGESFIFKLSGFNYSLKTVLIDITEIITPFDSQIILTPPVEQQNQLIGKFVEYYVFIEFENSNLGLVNSIIVNNELDCAENLNITMTNLNPMNIFKNVGLALHSSHICDTINDGGKIQIEGVNIGIIGGSDQNNFGVCSGVSGTFFYQDSTLFGLSDDIPDENMSGSDAIAAIENYLTSTNTVNFNFEYQNINNPNGSFPEKTNVLYQLFLAYSTLCDTFSVTTTSDTSICQGQTLQLSATGGQSYEWLPTADLSCSSCPNPIFTGDSSQYYTVRIWNNDSCSVVRPVKINVRPKPQFGTIGINPSLCGTNSGVVNLSAVAGTAVPLTYSMNGTIPQSTSVFDSLFSGTYTFTLTDAFSCSNDTLLTIPQVNNTVAQFTVDPSSGNVPLTVLISNESLFASDFSWSLNGLDQGNSFTSFTCDTSGIYTIQLIAWQYDPSCADTFALSISANDALLIPTAFTPDNDEVNDTWQIPNINTIYPKHSVQIYDRWGLLLFESVEGKYENNPWKGFYKDKTLPVGTYYFIIDPNDGVNEEVKGIVSIVK